MFNSASDTLSLAAGLAVLGVTLGDMVRTVLAAGGGGGIVSARLAEWQWLAVLMLHRRLNSHRMLRIAGVIIFGSVVALWLVALWAGWWLVFMTLDSVEASATGAPAGFWDMGYYSGFVLFTLGTGDYVPTGTPTKMLTIVATMSGLGLVTLAVAYLMPVVSAASNRRVFAHLVDLAGSTPAGLAAGALSDGEPAGVLAIASNLQEQVLRIGEQHLAYPILHYYHSASDREAFPVRLAALDEAATLMSAMPEAQPFRATRIEPLQAAIARLLEEIRVPGAQLTNDRPPRPVPPEALRAHSLTVDEAVYQSALDRRKQYRMRLSWLVEHDGWSWEDVARDRTA